MLELSDQGDDREIAGSLVGVDILPQDDFCNRSVLNVGAPPPVVNVVVDVVVEVVLEMLVVVVERYQRLKKILHCNSVWWWDD